MDYSSLKECLVNMLPGIVVLIGFLISGASFIAKLVNILDKSNLDDIKAEIKDETTQLGQEFKSLKSQYQEVLEQNAELKKHLDELLTELSKVKK